MQFVTLHENDDDCDENGVIEHYPSKVLGFIDVGNGEARAVIQCASNAMEWSSVEENFFVPFNLGTCWNDSFQMVPLTALVHPICVIKDTGSLYGDNRHIVVLPKRNWGQYFSDYIRRSLDDDDEDE